MLRTVDHIPCPGEELGDLRTLPAASSSGTHCEGIHHLTELLMPEPFDEYD